MYVICQIPRICDNCSILSYLPILAYNCIKHSKILDCLDLLRTEELEKNFFRRVGKIFLQFTHFSEFFYIQFFFPIFFLFFLDLEKKVQKIQKNILLILLFFQHFGEILSRVILIFPSYLG